MFAAPSRPTSRCRFERGECPAVADYLERFPALTAEKDRVVSLIYEEFCLLEERGESPDPSRFCDRYAPWRDSLASQLQYHQLLSRMVSPAASPRFPMPGEYFDRFQLGEILGKGGAAHVYLARDESLGGREVALKVSADRGNEPSILGRLDHAHIVPVLSVVFDAKTGLRGLCIPYRRGLPLDKVIQQVFPSSAPHRARALCDVVAELAPGGSGPGLKRGEWPGYPVRGRYAEGVALDRRPSWPGPCRHAHATRDHAP